MFFMEPMLYGAIPCSALIKRKDISPASMILPSHLYPHLHLSPLLPEVFLSVSEPNMDFPVNPATVNSMLNPEKFCLITISFLDVLLILSG